MEYKHLPLNTLAKIFGVIEDPRDIRGLRHKLLDIFILTIFGLLWGHIDFVNMVIDLRYHEVFFTELLGLTNGIPSHDTFSTVFSIINPKEFMECFIQWLVEINNTKGLHLAIDGKAVRAACEKVYSKRVPILVNTLLVETGICIGQLKIADKTNEIKGIPDLLKWLDIEGATVTIDAIGCQKEITKLIKEKGADYVIPVKDNQRIMHQDICLHMETLIAEQQFESELAREYEAKGIKLATPISDKLDIHQTFETDHSRIERRTYYLLDDVSCIDKIEWSSVVMLGMVVRERQQIHRNEDGSIIEEEPSVETETYVISRHMKAEEFAAYARGHWSIENSLHYVLDDALREDRCTARKGHAIENLGLMRKIVYNLMMLDPNVKGMSMKAKQIYYRNNPNAICELLFEFVPKSR